MKTCKKIIAVALVLMLAMAVMAPSAFAADYPSKGIYTINPWGADGFHFLAARGAHGRQNHHRD